MARERLLEIGETYPAEWFPAAVDEAIGAGVRKLNYVEAILERWRVDGFKTDRRKNGSKPAGPGLASLAADNACETCGSVKGRGWRSGCQECIMFLRASRGNDYVDNLLSRAKK